MSTKERLHKKTHLGDNQAVEFPAIDPRGFTYVTLAQALGMPRGTLSRRLIEHNRWARKEGEPEIKPDSYDAQPGYTKHYFHTDRLPSIREALSKTAATRKRGERAKNATT